MSTAPQVERLQSVAETMDSRPGVGDWRAFLHYAWSGLQWITRRVKVQHARRTLRVCESVSLGEKRFVAVVQVEDERFLIGGSSSSVSLLSRLPEAKLFAQVLDREAEK